MGEGGGGTAASRESSCLGEHGGRAALGVAEPTAQKVHQRQTTQRVVPRPLGARSVAGRDGGVQSPLGVTEVSGGQFGCRPSGRYQRDDVRAPIAQLLRCAAEQLFGACRLLGGGRVARLAGRQHAEDSTAEQQVRSCGRGQPGIRAVQRRGAAGEVPGFQSVRRLHQGRGGAGQFRRHARERGCLRPGGNAGNTQVVHHQRRCERPVSPGGGLRDRLVHMAGRGEPPRGPGPQPRLQAGLPVAQVRAQDLGEQRVEAVPRVSGTVGAVDPLDKGVAAREAGEHPTGIRPARQRVHEVRVNTVGDT